MEAGTLFLATIGAVTFSAGLGHVLGVSPIFVNMIFGYSVAVFSQQSLKMKRELDRVVRPLSIILFFFAGAYVKFEIAQILIVPLGLCSSATTVFQSGSKVLSQSNSHGR